MTGRLIFEARVTPWVEVDWPTVVAYRIWKRRTVWGWLQRHEWRPRGRNSTRKEDWTPSCAGWPSSAPPPIPLSPSPPIKKT